jgi:AP2 domain
MTPPRNIIRVDHEASHTHAWRVTLQRHNDIAVRTFSDSVYGGKRKALKAAVAYRNELLRRYSPYAHAIWVRTRLRRNNTSGIPGVGRYEERANPHTGYTRVFWLAFWANERGDSRKRRFMVSHYGERQAKRLAVAERERQLSLVCASKSAGL